jgi:hypothetical protein
MPGLSAMTLRHRRQVTYTDHGYQLSSALAYKLSLRRF